MSNKQTKKHDDNDEDFINELVNDITYHKNVCIFILNINIIFYLNNKYIKSINIQEKKESLISNNNLSKNNEYYMVCYVYIFFFIFIFVFNFNIFLNRKVIL